VKSLTVISKNKKSLWGVRRTALRWGRSDLNTWQEARNQEEGGKSTFKRPKKKKDRENRGKRQRRTRQPKEDEAIHKLSSHLSDSKWES